MAKYRMPLDIFLDEEEEYLRERHESGSMAQVLQDGRRSGSAWVDEQGWVEMWCEEYGCGYFWHPRHGIACWSLDTPGPRRVTLTPTIRPDRHADPSPLADVHPPLQPPFKLAEPEALSEPDSEAHCQLEHGTVSEAPLDQQWQSQPEWWDVWPTVDPQWARLAEAPLEQAQPDAELPVMWRRAELEPHPEPVPETVTLDYDFVADAATDAQVNKHICEAVEMVNADAEQVEQLAHEELTNALRDHIHQPELPKAQSKGRLKTRRAAWVNSFPANCAPEVREVVHRTRLDHNSIVRELEAKRSLERQGDLMMQQFEAKRLRLEREGDLMMRELMEREGDLIMREFEARRRVPGQ
mgnify:CR=1 FL=1